MNAPLTETVGGPDDRTQGAGPIPGATVDRPERSAPDALLDALLNHPWFGQAPDHRPDTDPTSLGTVPLPVEPFSLDATGPLAWWWAPAQAWSFRVQQHDLIWSPIDDRPSPFHGCVSQALAWLDRPLVWRVNNGEVQAVLMGLYRATFSAAHPAGRFERDDPIEGWCPCSVDEALEWLPLLQLPPFAQRKRDEDQRLQAVVQALLARMLARVIDQTARHVQRSLGARRLTLWEYPAVADGEEGLRRISAAPFPTRPLALKPAFLRTFAHHPNRQNDRWIQLLLGQDGQNGRWQGTWTLVDAWIVRWRQLTVDLANDLIRRFPLWKSLGPLVQTRGPGVLNAMNAWSARVGDAPNADLLFPLAMREGFRPTPYVWQESLWTPSVAHRPAVWRYALRGPRANVRWALSFTANVDALNVLGTLPEGQRPLLHAALRTVPQNTWEEAAAALRLDPASTAWPVRRLQAFLQEIARPGWVPAQPVLAGTLRQAQDVQDWALSLTTSPFTDPSWTWASLVERWVDATAAARPDWLAPLRSGLVQGFRLVPVTSEAQTRLMGHRFRNCLREHHGELYMLDMHKGCGVLYQLDGHGHTSLLALDWMNGAWIEQEHKAPANTLPPPSHRQMAHTLLMYHQHHVLPLRMEDEDRDAARVAMDKAQRATPMDRAQAGALRELQALRDPAWDERSEQGVSRRERWQRGWTAFVTITTPSSLPELLGALALLGLATFVVTGVVMMGYEALFG